MSGLSIAYSHVITF